MNRDKLEEETIKLELAMADGGFWDDTDKAKLEIKKYEELKAELRALDEVLKGGCILNIFTGAGGDDAEDWSAMLFEMYNNFVDKKNWQLKIIDENRTTIGGLKSGSYELVGKNIYGTLQNETGVHRLIRLSPFGAKEIRQTSFAYVEVLPILPKNIDVHLKIDDLEILTAKSGGPGGQNVNKRETAIRITHTPTGISVHVTSERSQTQNKELAMDMVRAKLYKLEEEKNKKISEGYTGDFNKAQAIEWGSQIRTYTMHPYTLVKDHRTSVENSDVRGVLGGDLEIFL
jgi:peptide chain release factor 2